MEIRKPSRSKTQMASRSVPSLVLKNEVSGMMMIVSCVLLEEQNHK